MSERLKELVSKTSVRFARTVGSNPTLSALNPCPKPRLNHDAAPRATPKGGIRTHVSRSETTWGRRPEGAPRRRVRVRGPSGKAAKAVRGRRLRGAKRDAIPPGKLFRPTSTPKRQQPKPASPLAQAQTHVSRSETTWGRRPEGAPRRRVRLRGPSGKAERRRRLRGVKRDAIPPGKPFRLTSTPKRQQPKPLRPSIPQRPRRRVSLRHVLHPLPKFVRGVLAADCAVDPNQGEKADPLAAA